MNFLDTRFVEAMKLLCAEERPAEERFGQDKGQPEHRRATRIGLHFPVQLKLPSSKPQDPWLIGHLRDISLRGVCIDTKIRLEAGSAFIMRFNVRSSVFGDQPLCCRVTNCRKTRNGTYRVGGEFAHTNPFSSFQPAASFVHG